MEFKCLEPFNILHILFVDDFFLCERDILMEYGKTFHQAIDMSKSELYCTMNTPTIMR